MQFKRKTESQRHFTLKEGTVEGARQAKVLWQTCNGSWNRDLYANNNNNNNKIIKQFMRRSNMAIVTIRVQNEAYS